MTTIRHNDPFFFMILTTFFLLSFCEKCTKLLPGVKQLAAGVDITALDFVPLGDPNSSQGFLENVFNFTCSGEKFSYYWDDNQDIISYERPDQLGYTRMAEEYNDNKVFFMSDAGSIRETFASQLRGTDDHYGFLGALSQNPKITSLLKQYFGSNKTFSQIEITTSTVRAELRYFYNDSIKQSFLSRDFLEFITRKLPPKYEDNPSIYQTFVQRFGTHYFESAFLSDYSLVRFALDPYYLLDSSDQQIGDNMRLTYFEHFKRWDTIKANNISNNKFDMEKFKSMSEIVLAYSSRKNGSQWKDGLTGKVYSPDKNQPKDLSLRWAKLHSITELIVNQTIKEQVGIAIQMHRIVAQLKELTNIYKFNNNYQLSNKEKDSFEKVSKLVNSGDVKQIFQMNEMLDELYDRARLAKDQAFFEPVIDDLYVTGAAKLMFAKQICAFSFDKFLRGQWSGHNCEAPDIRDGQEKTYLINGRYQNMKRQSISHYYDSMYSEFLDKFKEARAVNVRYGLRADIASGLKTSCGKC